MFWVLVDDQNGGICCPLLIPGSHVMWAMWPCEPEAGGGFVNVDIVGNISGQWIISLSFHTLSASIMMFKKKVFLDFSRDWAFQILPRFHCLATETKEITWEHV